MLDVELYSGGNLRLDDYAEVRQVGSENAGG